MKQTARIISVYTADVMGVCSALFELGGMSVMHDASGCNSTYNTHDEPRWYDTDSLVFISGLSEMEAIMGDDNKLIDDIVKAAEELGPKFIAVAGTPVPMMTGTDFGAVAKVIEKRTGIPTLGLQTNGMHSYISGAGMAFGALAERFVKEPENKINNGLNILGVTPLDFSVNGSAESLRSFAGDNGFELVGCWAMGGGLEEICKAGSAAVNLVVSACGFRAAETLQRRFGIPYVAAAPFGKKYSSNVAEALRKAIKTGKSSVPYIDRPYSDAPDAVIIGESVTSGSLAAALAESRGITARVICPVDNNNALLAKGDFQATDEDEIEPLLKGARYIIADPLYKPVCPESSRFVSLPHEAFSGRIFRKEIPNLVCSDLEF